MASSQEGDLPIPEADAEQEKPSELKPAECKHEERQQDTEASEQEENSTASPRKNILQPEENLPTVLEQGSSISKQEENSEKSASISQESIVSKQEEKLESKAVVVQESTASENEENASSSVGPSADITREENIEPISTPETEHNPASVAVELSAGCEQKCRTLSSQDEPTTVQQEYSSFIAEGISQVKDAQELESKASKEEENPGTASLLQDPEPSTSREESPRTVSLSNISEQQVVSSRKDISEVEVSTSEQEQKQRSISLPTDPLNLQPGSSKQEEKSRAVSLPQDLPEQEPIASKKESLFKRLFKQKSTPEIESATSKGEPERDSPREGEQDSKGKQRKRESFFKRLFSSPNKDPTNTEQEQKQEPQPSPSTQEIGTDIVSEHASSASEQESGSIIVPLHEDVLDHRPSTSEQESGSVIVPLHEDVLEHQPSTSEQESGSIIVPLHEDVLEHQPSTSVQESGSVIVPLHEDVLEQQPSTSEEDSGNVDVSSDLFDQQELETNIMPLHEYVFQQQQSSTATEEPRSLQESLLEPQTSTSREEPEMGAASFSRSLLEAETPEELEIGAAALSRSLLEAETPEELGIGAAALSRSLLEPRTSTPTEEIEMRAVPLSRSLLAPRRPYYVNAPEGQVIWVTVRVPLPHHHALLVMKELLESQLSTSQQTRKIRIVLIPLHRFISGLEPYTFRFHPEALPEPRSVKYSVVSAFKLPWRLMKSPEPECPPEEDQLTPERECPYCHCSKGENWVRWKAKQKQFGFFKHKSWSVWIIGATEDLVYVGGAVKAFQRDIFEKGLGKLIYDCVNVGTRNLQLDIVKQVCWDRKTFDNVSKIVFNIGNIWKGFKIFIWYVRMLCHDVIKLSHMMAALNLTFVPLQSHSMEELKLNTTLSKFIHHFLDNAELIEDDINTTLEILNEMVVSEGLIESHRMTRMFPTQE